MPRFDKMKKLAVRGDRTAEMTLYALEGEPVLILAPAGEANKPYFNELLRRNRRNLPRVQAGAVNSAFTKANRDDDRRLYAEHVVRGWRGVRDDDGTEVDFTQDNVFDFLTALPDHIFDDVRIFATSPYNFLEEQPADAEEMAGN